MGVHGDSDSIHGSDSSSTAIDPNSSKNTPTDSKFPLDARSQNIPSVRNGTNVQSDPKQPVPGWPSVAKVMAETPDFASFSRFRDLNIKSLLYYQTQLTILRKQLHDKELEDNRSEVGNEKLYAENAGRLIESGDTESKRTQWSLIKEIRLVLKEYSILDEALLQYSQVSALPEPESCNMKTFQTWLEVQEFDIMGSGEQHTWGNLYRIEKSSGSLKRRFVKLLWNLVWPKSSSSDELDLVAIRPPSNIDGFTRWVAGDFIPYYTDFCEYLRQKPASDDDEERVPTPPSEVVKLPEEQAPSEKSAPESNTLSTYSESSMLKFTSAVSTVVACLLPTVAIIVLAQVQGMRNLLLCLAGFAVIFSVGLIFLTSGTTSRVEIFTATAAFSAVLVVFISTPVVVVQE